MSILCTGLSRASSRPFVDLEDSPLGNARNIAFWVVLFLLILALFNLFGNGQTTMNSRMLNYSDFIQKVEADEVKSVVIDGEQLQVQTTDGTTWVAIKPEGEQLN